MEETLTLDQIVTEFVEEKEIKPFIEFLENKIIPLCGKIASQNLQRVEKHEWSRKVPINESIENVYQFFKQEINPIMAEQYMNLIRQEKKGHVKVKILPKSEYKNKDYYFNEIDEKGKVHIYFNETPYDMFAIIHEMIHQMNETYERIDNEKYQTELAQYFTESPSIMAEKLLGKWLVKNKKITHNDLRMVENNRLKDSKFCVREILIEHELIKMKQSGEELTPEDVLKRLTHRANNSPESIAKIFKQEIKNPTIINAILRNQTMGFIEGQQYIMGQHLSDNLKNRETPIMDFKWLHNFIGYYEVNFEDIEETIDDYSTNPNKMDKKDKNINEAVLEFIKNPRGRIYVANLEQMKEICEDILRQPYPQIEKEEWSRKVDINEAIEYNYKFLKTISPMIAEQFMNLLNQHDNSEKTVNIKPFLDEKKDIQRYDEGKVFVYYKNTPEDIFTILHEMVHAMNQVNQDFTEFGQNYIKEVPSIIIERLLGNWLVKNKIITLNDYNIIKRDRLEDSKQAACGVLIQKEIIDMKYKKGLYIIRSRIEEKFKNKCNIKNPENFSEIEEEKARYTLGRIAIDKKLTLLRSQRYIIGQYIADKVENSENPEKAFLRFHNFAGNVNLSSDRILGIIKKEYQQEDIDR